ncbi:MAG: hypothetical protein P8X76_15920, partial [Maritimibacter sp.]
MTQSIIFSPLLPLPLIWVAAALSLALIALALWRGLKGWSLRALAAALLLTALAGPSLQSEERSPEGDILIAVVDDSASQQLADRPDQTARALDNLRAQAEARGLELHVTHIADAPDNRGTLAMGALAQALAELPRDRVAGMVLISDGQVHDIDAAPDLPAPLHLIATGHSSDWDRRLNITTAPAFAILGEEQEIRLRIDDMGTAPGDESAQLAISIDGGLARIYEIPVGREMALPVTLSHGGQNVIRISTPDADGELTARNNAAVVAINGVRDRLRVLLVSGLPHPGTRTWRNLLKSDSAVDLVHFTILRSPGKQDGVPVNELSLIAFPTQELFLEKIDEFDLIIFDRYMLRGILPASYLDSVRDYVERGGAVLVAAGPDYADVQSLARSPLGDVLPGHVTARLIEQPFTPRITDLGQRHPVTRGLEDFAPDAGWGRWLRQVELALPDDGSAQVVMTGADGLPLLVLAHEGEGRVALLSSDHAWLWSRGFEGGGPQLELLRRLAHWMMKEPELEEEVLTASGDGTGLVITRRTLSDNAGDVVVTAPDGSETRLPLQKQAPGLYTARMQAPQMGLYRLREDDLSAVVAVGPAAPREFEETIASGEKLAPLLAPLRGGVMPVEAGLPSLRPIRPGRVAHGRGWIGYTPRGAYQVTALHTAPLAPGWLLLLIGAGLMVAAWMVEGRRKG